MLRFLGIGVVNTGVGYALFALFNYLLAALPYGYLLASVVATMLSIAFSYVTQRVFVFRSASAVRSELPRYYTVYGACLSVQLLLLWALVEGLGVSSYLAALAALPVVACVSYLAHKHISFGNVSSGQPGARGREKLNA